MKNLSMLSVMGPLLLLSSALVTACGGAAAPTQRVTSSQAAIRGAEEVGAPSNPQAQLHLKLAKEQLAQAQKLIEDDENEEAEIVLMRAEADAELAIALAKESAMQAEAAKARDAVERLKKEGK
jgi:hypothetical protein